MLTIVSYFLCHIRLLKYEEQEYEAVIPSESEPAKITEKETLKHKTFRTFSVPLKSEETEDIYQDYYPGMPSFLSWRWKVVFIALN